MEIVSLKMEERMLKDIDSMLERHRYSTRTEFIRDAIRDKLSDLEKEELLKAVARMKGASKRKTTDEELHKAGEEAFAILEKKFR